MAITSASGGQEPTELAAGGRDLALQGWGSGCTMASTMKPLPCGSFAQLGTHFIQLVSTRLQRLFPLLMKSSCEVE